jgi:hypothetical protein
MRLVHLAKRITPYWPDSAAARAAAELPLAQLSDQDELLVVGAAPVTAVEDFSTGQQFARRLEPLAVTGECEAVVLESTLTGTGIRLILLVLPPEHKPTGFAAAARALLRSLPDPPELLHLHGDTGVDMDTVREELDGPAVIQSVYRPTGSDGLAAAVQDADEVITPCGDLGETDPGTNGSAVGRALREHSRLRVVAHGIDLHRWDPSRDSALPAVFDTESLEGKTACKQALQRQAGLAPREDVPLIAVWSAGGPDNGLGLVAEHLEEILALDVQLVVLRPGFEAEDETLAALKGAQVWQADASDGRILRQVLAGSDAALLPDRTAPLGQRAMIATRYGLVPVARRINAHRDRLVEYDALSNTGGAFLFDQPEDVELMAALGRMRRIYGDKEIWPGLVRANGAVDVGWSRAVAQLREIYQKALAK